MLQEYSPQHQRWDDGQCCDCGMQDDQPQRSALLLCEVSSRIFRHQKCACRNYGNYITGQLGLRERKENSWNQKPDQQKHVQGIARLKQRLSLGSPRAYYLAAGSDNEYSPRHERKQRDGQVVPERVRVVIEVGFKARENLPKKKLVKELRIADLQRDVPGQRNKAEKYDTRNPQTLPQQANFTLNKEKNHDHQNRQKRRYGPFRERTQRKQSVEPGQINPVSALIPGVPTEQCNGESCGKSHVHGSGAGIPDDARAGGGDERAIKMKARPEAAQK